MREEKYAPVGRFLLNMIRNKSGDVRFVGFFVMRLYAAIHDGFAWISNSDTRKYWKWKRRRHSVIEKENVQNREQKRVLFDRIVRESLSDPRQRQPLIAICKRVSGELLHPSITRGENECRLVMQCLEELDFADDQGRFFVSIRSLALALLKEFVGEKGEERKIVIVSRLYLLVVREGSFTEVCVPSFLETRFGSSDKKFSVWNITNWFCVWGWLYLLLENHPHMLGLWRVVAKYPDGALCLESVENGESNSLEQNWQPGSVERREFGFAGYTGRGFFLG